MSGRRLSFTTLSLLALVLGLAGGLAAQLSNSAPLLGLASWLSPIGSIWINAIRMTVIPIVLTSLVLAVAGGADARTIGRLGTLSVTSFVTMLVFGGVVTALVMPPILSAFPPGSLSFGPAGAAGSASAGGSGASFVEWLVRLVPTNPFKAAAEGDILPLLVFTVPFALALTRLRPETRKSVLDVTRAVSEALFVMLRWILWLAPLAVFCLTYDLTARTGLTGLGAVGAFIAIVSALLIGFTLLLYPLATVVGRVPLLQFARAVRQAQIVAASTRSSLASLPALLQGVERHLHLPPAVTAFVLPLAVTMLRMNRTISSPAKLLFLAHAYAIQLEPFQIVTFIATVTLLSFTTPGVPSTGSLVTLPVYVSFGIPVEGVVILGAVDAVPDIFKTVTNVTADAAVTTVVARLSGAEAEADSSA